MAIDNSKYGISREDIEKAALGDFDDYEPSVSVQPDPVNVNVQSVDTDVYSDQAQDAMYDPVEDVYSDSGAVYDNSFIFCTACCNQLPCDAKFCTACGNPVAVPQDDIQYVSEPTYDDVQYTDDQLTVDYQNVDNQMYADDCMYSDAQYTDNSVIFCTSCGAQLSSEMLFCTSCGTPVGTTMNDAQYADNQNVYSHSQNDDGPTMSLDNNFDAQQSPQYAVSNGSFIFCTACGTQLPSDMRFCTSCGTPVGDQMNNFGFTDANQQPQKGSFFSKFKKNK